MNEEKAIEVLAHIEHSRGVVGVGAVGHNQNDWVQVRECGTTACMAGWTTLLDGWQPQFYERFLFGKGQGLSADDCVRDGVERDIADLAQEILDIDNDAASELFFESDSLGDLYEKVARMMGVSQEVLVDKVQDRVSGMSPFVLPVSLV